MSTSENSSSAAAQENNSTNDLQALVQKYRDFGSTLPADHSYDPVIIRLFQGFWAPEASFPGRLVARDLFTARPTDLFVLGNDPCGGTWIKALAFAVLHRKDYPSFADHPLVATSAQDLVRYIEWYYLTDRKDELDELPSPRLLATNSPYSTLPALFTASGLRIVYLCREPKDAFVSGWQYCAAKRPPGVQSIPIATALDLYLNGVIASGPAWNHTLEYWHESVKRPENVLFLRYEDLMHDLLGSLKKLAEFVGLPFSKEEEEKGVVEDMAKLCDYDNLSKLDVNKETSHRGQDIREKNAEPAPAEEEVKMKHTNAMFFANRKVGAWEDYLTPEMAQRFDDVMKEKLLGSGLSFD